MSHSIYLASTISLDKFEVKIYTSSIDSNLTNMFNGLSQELNEMEYPRQISDKLVSIENVSLIEIFNKNEILLLVTSSVLPEEIENYE